MKSLCATVLLAVGVPAGATWAAGVECGPMGGRIVQSQSLVVYVASPEGPLAVTDDPETEAALLAAGDVPVLNPDEICMQGWILPAPHPGEPIPSPGPGVVAPVLPPRPTLGVTPNFTPQVASSQSTTRPDSTSSTSTVEGTTSAAERAADVAEAEPVVVPAADEPTPTPAEPAARNEVRSLPDGCSTSGRQSGGSAALWGLLGLAGLRRRRGGR